MDELHLVIEDVSRLSLVFHILEYRINNRYIIKHFNVCVMYFDTDLIYKNHNDE
jgi:hypothetical protein